MDRSNQIMARQIAQAAGAFERERTGYVPVVPCKDTLVITLHEALSPGETASAGIAAGAAQVQELHQRLCANPSDSRMFMQGAPTEAAVFWRLRFKRKELRCYS